METSISECTLTEWASAAQKIESDAMPKIISPEQNIFSSLQFIDDEIYSYKRQTAFKLSHQGAAVAWASVYYLSPKVLRLRGLIVLPGHRNKHHMTALLRHISNTYKGKAESILSFSTEEAKIFHEKFGFKKVESFKPRPVEHYDGLTNTYSCNPHALLTLYTYSL